MYKMIVPNIYGPLFILKYYSFLMFSMVLKTSDYDLT